MEIEMIPDAELLRQFARTNSEAAFAELVKRHVNLVYSAAIRQVNGDTHLAQDVTQTVFTDLAQKANLLSQRENLSGWLYTSAYFAATKMVRGENRRRDREEKFMREPINETEVGRVTPCVPDWGQIRPALDDAMHELKETDRDAILLRYFENRQFAEVGAKLGLNENAARMRVERALEKLRAVFVKRGIATATALASVISANAIQMAPANLAVTLTTASIAAAGTGTFTLLKIMTATKIKLTLSAIVVAGATAAIVHQQQTQNKLRAENESFRQQIAQLQTDNQNFSNRLAEIGDAKKLSDDQFNELLKLRGEVGVFRQQINRLTELQAENQQLQSQMKGFEEQALENFPALTNVIQFKEHRIAMINAGKQIGLAIRMYADDNGGVYPTNLEQTTRYLGETNFPAFSSNTYGTSQLATNFPGDIGLNDFKIVNTGLASGQFPQMPMLEEQQPRWWDGQWERVYVLADGSIKLATSDSADFSAWEKKQLALSLGAPNQNQ